MTTTATTGRIVPPIGAHAGVSFAEYASWDAINWHKLEPFRRSAKHGHHAMLLPRDSADCQVFGGAFHAAILEPAAFERDYATMPRFVGHPNSNAHKDAKARWIEAHRTKVHISAANREMLTEMARSVRAHPIASAMLAGKGRNELSIVWRDEETGALCKARVDRICRVKAGVLNPHAANADDDALCLADLKSTCAIEVDRFDREIAKYGYHGQLAMQMDGLNALEPAALHPYLIAVENDPPYDVVVRALEEDVIEHGRRLYRRLLKTQLACERAKDWPGISDLVIPVVLPKWAEEQSIED